MTDVLDEIARELKDNKVVVYMKGTPSFPMCGFSAATVQVLREVGVPFKAIDRWNGSLPQFTGGGAVPFLNLKDLGAGDAHAAGAGH